MYGTPNETKISKRKQQQIVSESSFDVAIDYDFIRPRNRLRLRSRNRIRLRSPNRIRIRIPRLRSRSRIRIRLRVRYISQWYNLGAQGARKDHLLAGAFITSNKCPQTPIKWEFCSEEVCSSVLEFSKGVLEQVFEEFEDAELERQYEPFALTKSCS